MKKNQVPVNLFLVAVFLFACFIPANNPDPFYSAWRDWDGPRFPLIYPYDVFYIGQNEGWAINLRSTQKSEELRYYQSINDVDQISVDKGLIMIHSSYEEENEVNNTDQVMSWFVIIPNEEVERGFYIEADFLEFIKAYGIERVINWESPETLNKKFLNTGCLEWIPGCL